MYDADAIAEVHLEITARCNAACPQCPRNLPGGAANPDLPLAELSAADLEAILPDDFVRRLRKVYLCGNYGDPMAARDTLPALERLRAVNPGIQLGIHTNGGGRDPAWWARLAGVVSYCRFGIDGLEDTNHLYRRGVEWRKVMAATEAFIAAGAGRGGRGAAEWDFIVFRHNEHQVDAARDLAARMGFRKFFAKRTGRFFSPREGRTVERLDVTDRDGEVEYTLEPPADPVWRNPVAVQLDLTVGGRDGWRKYLETAPVRCKVLSPAKIYVSAEGLVFPCCFMGNLYPPGRPPRSAQIWRFLERLPGGVDSLNAKLRPIREIIDGPFFRRTVPDAWRPGSLDPAGDAPPARLEVCARVCGEFDLHAGQFGQSLL
jgi:MoaA/NifB/PqqE/SkfB family radical SAM enzyme